MGLDIKDDIFYTAEEAAVLLKVKPLTINNYFRQGTLKGHKRGAKKKWFVQGKEIKRKMKEFGYLD